MNDAHAIGSRIKDPDFYASLGATIRILREIADKTQEEVAAYLKVSYQQVQKYEDGRNRIPIDRLVSLSRYLDVPVERFFGFSKGATEVRPEIDRLFSSLNRQDIRFLTLWSDLRDRRDRLAVLAVLERFNRRPASEQTGFAVKHPPDTRFLGRES